MFESLLFTTSRVIYKKKKLNPTDCYNYIMFLVTIFIDYALHNIILIHLTIVLFCFVFVNRIILILQCFLDTRKIKHYNGVAKLPIKNAV